MRAGAELGRGVVILPAGPSSNGRGMHGKCYKWSRWGGKHLLDEKTSALMVDGKMNEGPA
jgi:hypothetical protein